MLPFAAFEMGQASFLLPLADTLIKVGFVAALLMGVLFGAQRIYQAGFQEAAQKAQVRDRKGQYSIRINDQYRVRLTSRFQVEHVMN